VPSSSALDPLVKAVADIARSVADIYTRLSNMEAQRQPPPSMTASAGFPYRTAALPFQGVQATAPVPIHQLRMPPSLSPVPSYVMASTAGPVFTSVTTPPFTAATVASAATTGGPSN
jgi:hypothetical protein